MPMDDPMLSERPVDVLLFSRIDPAALTQAFQDHQVRNLLHAFCEPDHLLDALLQVIPGSARRFLILIDDHDDPRAALLLHQLRDSPRLRRSVIFYFAPLERLNDGFSPVRSVAGTFERDLLEAPTDEFVSMLKLFLSSVMFPPVL